MEEAYQDAIEKIKTVILFLNKLKLDKKVRTEKEDLVKGLDATVTKSANFLDQDVYDEVENTKQLPNEPESLYDDSASPEEIAAQNDVVYFDTADPQAVPSQSYDDCQTIQGKCDDVIHDVTCEELRDATLCDFLNVKRERNILKGSWQRRWCVIHQNIFYMYDSSKDKKQKEAFDLNGFHFEARDDIAKDRGKRDRCFELRNNATQKYYEFFANEKESLAKWQKAVNDASKNYKNSPLQPRRSTLNQPDSPSQGESGKAKGKLINMFGFTTKKKAKDATQMVIEPSDELYTDNVVSPIPTVDEENENMYDDNVVEQTYDDTQAPGDDGETYEELECVAKPKKGRADSALPPIPRTSSEGSMGGRPPPIPNTPKPAAFAAKNPPGPSGKSDSLPPVPPPKDLNLNIANFPPPTIPDESRPLPKFHTEEFPLPPPERTSTELLDEKNLENWFQGIWDCEANDDGELSFKKGDVMHVISKEFDSHGWWAAKINNVVGLVPSAYLMEAYIT